MIHLKNSQEIEELRTSALMVGDALAEVAKAIKPGITTLELDKIAEDYIHSLNAKPAFKNYNGFPASLCISLNEEVVHGIPSQKELKEGDIVSIDCGVNYGGWIGDSAYTFALKGISDRSVELLKTTKESLYIGIEQAKIGKRIGDLGHAIQEYCETRGFSIVRDLCGHGIGRNLHEDPEVPNFGRRGSGIRFREGMVLAVEPMVTEGKKEVVFESDGWTCRTLDRSMAAHFEHDIAITKDGPIILSSFDKIEEAINSNNNLFFI